jgi:hypothetical protein
LIVLVFNLLGGIKGVSSFIDAFRMADGSSEHVVWSGMGGFCLALLFFDQVRFSLRVNLSAKWNLKSKRIRRAPRSCRRTEILL